MKSKDVIIGLLVIGIFVVGVLYYRKNEQFKENEREFSQFRIKACCMCVNPTRKVSDSDENRFCYKEGVLYGNGFGPSQVEEVSQMIKEAKRLNPCNEIYGYQISLEHVQEMYETIMAYNADPEKKDSVAGIRFYEAVSEREIDGKKLSKVDLVMIPYLMSGYDVFEVDRPDLYPQFKMYAHFRPCPRLCVEQYAFFSKKH